MELKRNSTCRLTYIGGGSWRWTGNTDSLALCPDLLELPKYNKLELNQKDTIKLYNTAIYI